MGERERRKAVQRVPIHVALRASNLADEIDRFSGGPDDFHHAIMFIMTQHLRALRTRQCSSRLLLLSHVLLYRTPRALSCCNTQQTPASRVSRMKQDRSAAAIALAG